MTFINDKRKGIVFVISAPSGCGKTTICSILLEKISNLTRSVSYTTRPPRKQERNKLDYYFVGEKQFKNLQKKNKFVEHAKVFGYSYGTPKSAVQKALRQGRDIVLSIDVKGALQVKRIFKTQCVSIFILPPSFQTLQARLEKRHADTKKQIAKRLRIAKKEITYLKEYDYAVVNNKLNKAVADVTAIITAERKRIK